jgi:hypothetical protein
MGAFGEFGERFDEGRWEPAPAWLQAMADAVARDLGDDGPLPLDVSFAPRRGPDALGDVRVRFADGGGAFSIGLLDAPADQLAAIASAIQDEWSESSAGWGEARPPCPGHAHPARVAVDGDAAWWSCPRDGRRLAPVGALPR